MRDNLWSVPIGVEMPLASIITKQSFKSLVIKSILATLSYEARDSIYLRIVTGLQIYELMRYLEAFQFYQLKHYCKCTTCVYLDLF